MQETEHGAPREQSSQPGSLSSSPGVLLVRGRGDPVGDSDGVGGGGIAFFLLPCELFPDCPFLEGDRLPCFSGSSDCAGFTLVFPAQS